jgi:hypothetical protein
MSKDHYTTRRLPEANLPRSPGTPPASGERTEGAPGRKRLERSVYRWKDYQSWAERVRQRWESDL